MQQIVQQLVFALGTIVVFLSLGFFKWAYCKSDKSVVSEIYDELFTPIHREHYAFKKVHVPFALLIGLINGLVISIISTNFIRIHTWREFVRHLRTTLIITTGLSALGWYLKEWYMLRCLYGKGSE